MNNRPKYSMRKKMLYVYIPLLLVPLMVFALISSHFYRQAIIQRSLASMGDHAHLLIQRVDEVVEQGNSCGTYLTLGINQIYNNAAPYSSAASKLKYDTWLSNELSYARLVFQQVDHIAFVDTQGQVFTSSPMHLMHPYDPVKEQKDYIKILENSSGNRIWFPLAKRTWLNDNRDMPILTMGKKVWHTQTGKTLGYLIINIKMSTLTEGFTQNLATYLLADSFGTIQATADEEQVFNPIANATVAEFATSTTAPGQLTNKGLLMIKAPLQKLNLSIIGYGRIDDHTPDLKQAYTLMGLAALMVMAMALLFNWFSQRWITGPIQKLHSGVEALANGQFSHALEVTSRDEIGQFAMHFNGLSARIEALMAQQIQESKRRRQLELARLQEQIKPHFLYNTLDIITKLIDLGDSRKAKRAAKKLAAFYQRSLSNGSECVTIQEEVAILQDYMAIQNIRYGDVFNLEVEVDEGLCDMLIPKLTLQPLVENAIYHGLKVANEGSRICLKVCLDAKATLLTLWDEGIGMTPDQLEAVNGRIHHILGGGLTHHYEGRQGGFGIVNVAERLRLFYGNQIDMTYSPGQPTGTLITIVIPERTLAC